MPIFEGNRETKTILWNREHKINKFRIYGEQANFSGEQGNSNPLGRASLKIEPITSIRYKLACEVSEDSNQSAHSHSLVSFRYLSQEALDPCLTI